MQSSIRRLMLTKHNQDYYLLTATQTKRGGRIAEDLENAEGVFMLSCR
jgi:hypothetical protein